ncbi:hypothetical protein [Zobellia uliginosa]|nr:hypothetical protein [Zobellia uliginosa]
MKSTANSEEKVTFTAEQIDHLGITDTNHLSAASKRALKWPTDLGNEWFIQFGPLQPLKGIWLMRKVLCAVIQVL